MSIFVSSWINSPHSLWREQIANLSCPTLHFTPEECSYLYIKLNRLFLSQQAQHDTYYHHDIFRSMLLVLLNDNEIETNCIMDNLGKDDEMLFRDRQHKLYLIVLTRLFAMIELIVQTNRCGHLRTMVHYVLNDIPIKNECFYDVIAHHMYTVTAVGGAGTGGADSCPAKYGAAVCGAHNLNGKESISSRDEINHYMSLKNHKPSGYASPTSMAGKYDTVGKLMGKVLWHYYEADAEQNKELENIQIKIDMLLNQVATLTESTSVLGQQIIRRQISCSSVMPYIDHDIVWRMAR